MSANIDVIFGPPSRACRFGIDRLFRRFDTGDRYAVLDYTGRGASLLTASDQWIQRRSRLEWLDMSAARRPVGITAVDQNSADRELRGWLIYALLSSVGTPDRSLTERISLVWFQRSALGRVSLHATLRYLLAERGKSAAESLNEEEASIIEHLVSYPSLSACLGDWNPRRPLPDTRWFGWYEISAWREDRRIADALSACALFDLRRIWQIEAVRSKQSRRWKLLHILPPYWMVTELLGDAYNHASQLIVLSGSASTNSSEGVSALVDAASTTYVLHAGTRKPRNLPERIEKAVRNMNPIGDDGVCVINPSGEGIVWHGAKADATNVHLAHQLRVLSARGRNAVPVHSFRPAAFVPTTSAIQHISQPANLLHAWSTLRRKRRLATGIDCVTKAQFAANALERIHVLSNQVVLRTYRPRCVKRVYIAKRDGGERPIGIAAIRDRVLQRATVDVLNSRLDAGFSAHSYAYRAGRNALNAVSHIHEVMRANPDSFVVSTDISKCFENFHHGRLLEYLSRRCDEGVIWLMSMWLRSEVRRDPNLTVRMVGVEQGLAVAPFLANIYLDILDKFFESSGVLFARYADDIVFFADSERTARALLGRTAQFLRDELHLELKPAKTEIHPVGVGTEYLGFDINPQRVVPAPDRVLAMLTKTRDFAHQMASGELSALEQGRTTERFHSLLIGFRNYFSGFHDTETIEVLGETDVRIDRVLNRYLPPSHLADPMIVNRPKLVRVDLSEDAAQHNLGAEGVWGYVSMEAVVSTLDDSAVPAPPRVAAKHHSANESELQYLDSSEQHHVAIDGYGITVRAGADDTIELVSGRAAPKPLPEKLASLLLYGRNHKITSGALRRAHRTGITILITDFMSASPVVIPPADTSSFASFERCR